MNATGPRWAQVLISFFAVGYGWGKLAVWCGTPAWAAPVVMITVGTCHLLLTTSLWADLRSAWGWRRRQYRVWRDARSIRRNAHKPRTF